MATYFSTVYTAMQVLYIYSQKRDFYLLLADQKWLSTEAFLTHICSRQMALRLYTLVPCDNCMTTLFQITVPHAELRIGGGQRVN
jgi:hypothetical protein